MRRNAESLLVLTGIEPPRTWIAPVRLTDVVRAAMGEVEYFHRVTVHDVEPTMILGSAAADLAHLIAELLENALHFSPADQTVQIRGRRRRAGDDYELAIVDTGVGIPPAAMEQANRRLAGAESFTVAPSKYLGHYVAGNLAARHEIAIRLGGTPGRGLTARITLPRNLLVPDAIPMPDVLGPDMAGVAVAAAWKPRPVPTLPTVESTADRERGQRSTGATEIDVVSRYESRPSGPSSRP